MAGAERRGIGGHGKCIEARRQALIRRHSHAQDAEGWDGDEVATIIIDGEMMAS